MIASLLYPTITLSCLGKHLFSHWCGHVTCRLALTMVVWLSKACKVSSTKLPMCDRLHARLRCDPSIMEAYLFPPAAQEYSGLISSWNQRCQVTDPVKNFVIHTKAAADAAVIDHPWNYEMATSGLEWHMNKQHQMSCTQYEFSLSGPGNSGT